MRRRKIMSIGLIVRDVRAGWRGRVPRRPVAIQSSPSCKAPMHLVNLTNRQLKNLPRSMVHVITEQTRQRLVACEVRQNAAIWL